MDFDQFVLKGTKVANPLLAEAQLLGDERLQPGPYHGASFGSKFADQGFEIGQRNTQGAGTSDEHQPIHIRTRILSVS